jgi:ABC-type nitrate/sulfonate/bicarbonate transport system ATPase subunit
MSAHIQVRDVTKRFGAMTALDRVALDIGRGEFAAVVGPSGCGKSTLMRIVAGLDTADGGGVHVGGRPVAGPHPGVGIVFQSAVLLPWKTVRGNIGFPFEMGGVFYSLSLLWSQVFPYIARVIYSKADLEFPSSRIADVELLFVLITLSHNWNSFLLDVL